MLGAIIGDIAGSVYEFANIKHTNFPFFSARSSYTDDSILSVAVAGWLLKGEHSPAALTACLQHYGQRYPNPMGAYGARFKAWLQSPRPSPYNSWGNGSAMRVSAVGWFFATLSETERMAQVSAAVTHNHPEGIKGAKAVAAAIFLARTGASKADIRAAIESRFAYDLQRSCAQIRPGYSTNESCQGTVPEALIAFLESENFEHAIRLAISLGGDSDTLACITGAVAEAFYKKIPQDIALDALLRLPGEFLRIMHRLAEKSFYQWPLGSAA